MKIKRSKPTPISKADKIATSLAKYLNGHCADHELRLAVLNATRDENSCPQGLLNMAWSLVELAQVVLENAEHAAKYEDKLNAKFKGTDEESPPFLPFIKEFDKALQTARDDVAGSVPLE
jgi:hypothetical protein